MMMGTRWNVSRTTHTGRVFFFNNIMGFFVLFIRQAVDDGAMLKLKEEAEELRKFAKGLEAAKDDLEAKLEEERKKSRERLELNSRCALSVSNFRGRILTLAVSMGKIVA